MASVTIRLNSIGEVKEFNRIAATLPGDVDLHSGRYCVDAKSIMGIFALNLARELTVDSPTLSEEELHKKFGPFWRTKAYLKTKKMTDTSQTQAGCKAF